MTKSPRQSEPQREQPQNHIEAELRNLMAELSSDDEKKDAPEGAARKALRVLKEQMSVD